MSEPVKWKCPKCDIRITAIATQVSHRCPSNKNQYTDFEEVAKG